MSGKTLDATRRSKEKIFTHDELYEEQLSIRKPLLSARSCVRDCR